MTMLTFYYPYEPIGEHTRDGVVIKYLVTLRSIIGLF